MTYLPNRREILFLYDVQMANPNGDPDENRPRILPDGTIYVTDVRLKRFVRDYFKRHGMDILVDQLDDKIATLSERVKIHLSKDPQNKPTAKNIVSLILNSFIDARLFGSTLAIKPETVGLEKTAAIYPKTITGPVQFNMGEVLHSASIIDIAGTSVMASKEDNKAGTFTDFSVLRYGLIGFAGVVNQYAAQISQMTEADYDRLLVALWRGVQANTRSKIGQIPLLLISIEYHPEHDYQIGRLHDLVRASGPKPEKHWSSPDDYVVNLERLHHEIQQADPHIRTVRYVQSSRLSLDQPLTQLSPKWEVFYVDSGTTTAIR